MVWDGRKARFSWDETGILGIRKLPSYNEELSVGSLALVAWTASAYGKDVEGNYVSLSCNVNWVVLLADIIGD
jgi:hypothetical protein